MTLLTGTMLLATLAFVTGAHLGAEPAPTPRVDWLFDGGVNATARVGNTLYVGGQFTGVAPSTALFGSWAALDTTTGAVVPGLPYLDGAVYAVEPDGAGGFFVAGTFSNAGAGGLAHIRPDGTVDPVFTPQITASAASPRLARVGPSLIVGGRAVPLRALDLVTGATSSWMPALPDPAVGPFAAANGRLFVMTGDAAANRRVTAFDGTSGAVIWTSAVIGNAGGFPDPSGGAMTIANGRIFVATSKLYALDADTGAIDPVWGGA